MRTDLTERGIALRERRVMRRKKPRGQSKKNKATARALFLSAVARERARLAPASCPPSPPSSGDLATRFFDSSPSDAWLAYELELRDPRVVRKMTPRVALRRARFAKYVVGVVGVAAALGMAALIKSVVVQGDSAGAVAPAARRTLPVLGVPRVGVDREDAKEGWE
jgi:hypothetical protein